MQRNTKRYKQNTLFRIARAARATFCAAVLCLLGSCSSESDSFESLAPESSSSTYSAIIQAVNTPLIRTSLDPDDLMSTYWSTDDKIALWAKNNDSGEFALEATTFSMFYYGSSYDSAVFTAEIDAMDSGDYTYYACYPTPASTSGTTARFNIPSTQSGYYDGDLDIMVSQAASGSELSDNSLTNASLNFSHLTHAIRIAVPANRDLLGGTTKLQITFPQDVVGEASVDVSAAEPEITLTNASNTIYIDFDQVISSAGYVWVFIAPTTIDGDIEFMGFDSDYIPSDYITTSLSNFEMAAGEITPLTLTIPTEQPKQFVLKVDKNYLGEDIEKATLTAPSGAFFSSGLSSTTITPNSDGELMFSYYTSLYDDYFKAGSIAVTYESASAIVEGEGIVMNGEYNSLKNYVSVDLPYLFEEDFSLVSSSASGTSSVTIPGYTDKTWSWTIGSRYEYWANTSVAIKAYNSSTNNSFSNSSLVLSSIPTLKTGASVNINVYFHAGWSSDRCGSMSITVNSESISLSDETVAYNSIPTTERSASISSISPSSTITWTTSAGDANWLWSSTESVYIDNIRISITSTN